MPSVTPARSTEPASPSTRLRFIDAHHHLWDPDTAPYPWMGSGARKFMGDTAPVCRRYLLADFRQEAAAVDLIGSVHLQCGRQPDDPVAETAWIAAQAERAGFPIAIVGFCNLAEPAAPDILARHAAYPAFRGVRHMLNWGEDEQHRLCDRGDYLGDRAWRRGFEALTRHGLSFDLQVNAWQLAEAAALARAYPQTPIILNHAGLPIDRSADGLAQWRDGLAALAACPNVDAKISGLGMTDPHWTGQSLAPIVTAVIAAFGVERCMFGSNFPIDRLYAPYSRYIDAYRSLTAGFTDRERDALFWRTAARAYRMNLASTGIPS